MTQDKDERNGVWVTPSADFEPYRAEFNLEVDAAASKDNAMLPEFWDAAKDAFNQDWKGRRVWCNPPYGRREIYRWVKQCATGGAAVVVALLPARTDTLWFHDFIYNKLGVTVRFRKGRIKFSGTSGSGKFPSMYVIFSNPTSAASFLQPCEDSPNTHWWSIIYEDADRKPELFTDETAARQTLSDRLVSWNCYLFKRVSPSWRPDGERKHATR